MAAFRVLWMVILSVLFFSCSIDYGDNALPDKLMDNIPDNILYDFVYTENEGGHRTFSVYAEKAEIFNEKQQTLLTGVVFRQFDSEDNLVSEGRADNGTIFTENNNAEIYGNLDIYSSREEAEVKTSYLYWDNDKKTLTGEPDKTITIIRDSGTVITGRDFEADMKTKVYHLGNGVRGEYVYEKE